MVWFLRWTDLGKVKQGDALSCKKKTSVFFLFGCILSNQNWFYLQIPEWWCEKLTWFQGSLKIYDSMRDICWLRRIFDVYWKKAWRFFFCFFSALASSNWSRWWQFQHFLCSPRSLGKWWNLTMKYCSNGLVQPPTSDEPSNPSDFAGVSLPFSEAQLPGDGVKVLDMESRCRSKPENPMDGRGLSKSDVGLITAWDGHFLKPLLKHCLGKPKECQMFPENQWLEDEFPVEIVHFCGDMLDMLVFGGVNSANRKPGLVRRISEPSTVVQQGFDWNSGPAYLCHMLAWSIHCIMSISWIQVTRIGLHSFWVFLAVESDGISISKNTWAVDWFFRLVLPP